MAVFALHESLFLDDLAVRSVFQEENFNVVFVIFGFLLR